MLPTLTKTRLQREPQHDYLPSSMEKNYYSPARKMRIKKIKCMVCNASFKSKFCVSLHRHVHLQSAKIVTGYHCNLCKKQFSKLEGLERHCQYHRYSDAVRSSRKVNEETGDNEENGFLMTEPIPYGFSKAELTPSKAERESAPKCREDQLQNKDDIMQTAYQSTDISARNRLSGKYYKNRRDSFLAVLKEKFIQSFGDEVPRSDILNILQLSDSSADKRVATKAMTDTFGLCYYNRYKDTYCNVKKITAFADNLTEGLELDKNSVIEKIRDQIRASSDCVDSWRSEINNVLKEKQPDLRYLGAVFAMYDNEVQKLEKQVKTLDELYIFELKILIEKKCDVRLPQNLNL